ALAGHFITKFQSWVKRSTSPKGQHQIVIKQPRLRRGDWRRLDTFFLARRLGAAFFRPDFEAAERLRPERDPELVFFAAIV
ncbi:MAG: hypothetical protein ACPIA7_00535, partial [Akkermansiaceae bacterium]